MATTRIKDLTAATVIAQADSFVVDIAASNETRKVGVALLLEALGIPSSTVAGLPSGVAATGPMRYCTDGRKQGEGAGVGTGQIAIRISSSWLSVDDGSAISA